MTVDLEADKQDFPQPSDLSSFVNETKFSSPTEELDYRNAYEIEYMEKIGSSLPVLAKEREVSEWKEKYEESRREVMEMRKIVAEYEKTIAQMIGPGGRVLGLVPGESGGSEQGLAESELPAGEAEALAPETRPGSVGPMAWCSLLPEDEQREKSVSHQTVQQLVLEKEQALADLNSVEKSLADLFRRYEKMKEVLEGFRKNEEVLKKCAQEYLSRVKKEEQRYQALKVHAEEKLDR
ncbi:Transforming acidic coiled-coil-containing protein 2 [Myotis brandtii]|uniref:Transforming acidic coiled-coil-containing protein 2 n=1 Tax=Myotis brandtii TaxID=109478 RepID=S7Q6A1_MYOBR|nr:Transforming acidic coiled-coil-containing protein 2 [Myotis brandtii]